jgi:hypothetical protein
VYGWEKDDGADALQANRKKLDELQDKLYADGAFEAMLTRCSTRHAQAAHPPPMAGSTATCIKALPPTRGQ